MKKKYIIRQIVSIFFLAAFITSSVSAADEKTPQKKCDEAFYSLNDVGYYNPCEVACATGTAGAVTSLKGDNNKVKIWNWLLSNGLSPEQAAGVLSNIKTESGGTFSPTINEYSFTFPEGGYGLVQWTHSPGRRADVVKYMTEKVPDLMAKYYNINYSMRGAYTDETGGYVPKNATTGESMPVGDNDGLLLAQLDFLLKESTERTLSGGAVSRGYGSSSDTEWETIKKQTTVKGASDVWVYSFERPADVDATAASRAAYAETLLTEMKGASTSGDTAKQGACATDPAAAANDFVYYSQLDPKWVNSRLAVNGYIGSDGCAPTSLAMMVATLADKNVTPVEMTALADSSGAYTLNPCNNSTDCGVSNSKPFVQAAANNYKLEYKSFEPYDFTAVAAYVKAGGLVMMNGNSKTPGSNNNDIVKAGPFSQGGHFVVIKGVSDDGKKLIIANPYSTSTGGTLPAAGQSPDAPAAWPPEQTFDISYLETLEIGSLNGLNKAAK